ncbi:hypothetical protein Ssi03_76060 [Sphaerisporangium siamense]|uniref:Uncharacterized protein n=1 Tax=Sphaerisporangium siamense TaxID=795645 RepID=A0A7W7D2X1_9ACTN|nr:hypothetical protein [Sphaerisporangium siamense]MBB4699287.1 hypothetical protein [Sphaerisporangium siamense]GII89616.1 hypothetical protein Ssi03_76060 [Sphaerisporangium siamense]
MTIRTLALASGVTSIQDHRLALGAFMAPGASVLERRPGLYYYPGAADLVSAAALQANVTPFVAVIDGTSNALQGQVLVVVDANVTLTFSAGEPSVARTDRVILQVRDNVYDASGFTDAQVLVLKGNTSTGAATTMPASSLLLWEVTVPSGASSITFASARTDKRQWMATPLRVPVNSSTERDALPAIPGLEVTRLDTGNVEQYWSGAWRSSGGGGGLGTPTFTLAGTIATGTGTARFYNDSGQPLVIKGVRASVGTAPTGASILVDVNLGGTTIFTTQANRPAIAASSNTSGKVTNMNVTAWPDGGYLTIDIDQVGSTIAGADLVVQVIV